MPRLHHLLAPALALACAACVTEEAEDEPIAGLSTDRQCFFLQQVNGYSEAPDGRRGERIYVHTGVNERFLLETWGACPEIDWTFEVGIDPNFGAGSICSGESVTLVIPRSSGGQPADRCTARVLGQMLED